MNSKKWVLGVLMVFFVSGCSTISPIKDKNAIKHIISIDRDGSLENVRPGKEIKTVSSNGSLSYQEYFDKIINGIRGFKRTNIDGEPDDNGSIKALIYIHGGLNTKNSALERVEDKFQSIKDKNIYPIFVNWRSGPLTTYSSHLVRIRQGEIDQWAPYTSPTYFFTDIGSSLINAPKSWLVSNVHLFNATFFREKDEDFNLDNLKNGNNGVFFTGNKKYSSASRRLRWLLTSPAKLVSTPFTYTMAKPAWDIMLRRTNTLFYKPSDLRNEDCRTEYGTLEGNGALAIFLRQLSNEIKKPGFPPVEITLVGHSMGAIVVNKIINFGIDLPYKNIVHMASADSIKNLFEQVVPYVATNDVKFYSLSLHPKNEDREVSAYGLTPSGSLLVWIDDMFTTPETIMNKRSGRWDNMKKVLPLLPESVKGKMHFKIYGLDDSRTEPQSHGDFGDTSFWLKSTWWQ